MRAARLALALGLLLSLLPVQAKAAEDSPFDGFYLGLGGGAGLMSVEASGERGGGTKEGQAWQASVFFGSMARLGPARLGVEFELAAQPLRVDLGQGERLSLDGFWGARALIGATPWPTTLVYFAPGARFTTFRHERENFKAGNGDSRLAHGLSLGAGLEQVLAQGLLLRLELCVTRWSDLEVRYLDENYDSSGLILEPTSYGAALALVYDF